MPPVSLTKRHCRRKQEDDEDIAAALTTGSLFLSSPSSPLSNPIRRVSDEDIPSQDEGSCSSLQLPSLEQPQKRKGLKRPAPSICLVDLVADDLIETPTTISPDTADNRGSPSSFPCSSAPSSSSGCLGWGHFIDEEESAHDRPLALRALSFDGETELNESLSLEGNGFVPFQLAAAAAAQQQQQPRPRSESVPCRSPSSSSSAGYYYRSPCRSRKRRAIRSPRREGGKPVKGFVLSLPGELDEAAKQLQSLSF
jgi:hypothetical protein